MDEELSEHLVVLLEDLFVSVEKLMANCLQIFLLIRKLFHLPTQLLPWARLFSLFPPHMSNRLVITLCKLLMAIFLTLTTVNLPKPIQMKLTNEWLILNPIELDRKHPLSEYMDVLNYEGVSTRCPMNAKVVFWVLSQISSTESALTSLQMNVYLLVIFFAILKIYNILW